MKLASICAAFATCMLIGTALAQETPSCKAVQHYGVKGCDLLPDKSCPPGYHKQAVGPPNPQMMGPTFLMCVADKALEKEQPPKPKKEKAAPEKTR